MIKKLLFVFLLACSLSSKSQVVFCPPGAEWHYSFQATIFSPQISNEKIQYVGDSISGTDTLKILSHNRFFMSCNYLATHRTLIKQKGDTIFMKNQWTLNTWQILYNFAAQKGQSWQTTIKRQNDTATFTSTVDSVDYITINNMPLKRLIIGTTNPLYFVERIGCYGVSVFYFPNTNHNCDGEFFKEALCYQDNTLGIYQYGAKPCDFTNFNGIEENSIERFIISPNPVTDYLKLNVVVGEIRISDVYGREVKRIDAVRNNSIEVGDLSPGVYFISLSQNGRIVYNNKLLKE